MNVEVNQGLSSHYESTEDEVYYAEYEDVINNNYKNNNNNNQLLKIDHSLTRKSTYPNKRHKPLFDPQLFNKNAHSTNEMINNTATDWNLMFADTEVIDKNEINSNNDIENVKTTRNNIDKSKTLFISPTTASSISGNIDKSKANALSIIRDVNESTIKKLSIEKKSFSTNVKHQPVTINKSQIQLDRPSHWGNKELIYNKPNIAKSSRSTSNKSGDRRQSLQIVTKNNIVNNVSFKPQWINTLTTKKSNISMSPSTVVDDIIINDNYKFSDDYSTSSFSNQLLSFTNNNTAVINTPSKQNTVINNNTSPYHKNKKNGILFNKLNKIRRCNESDAISLSTISFNVNVHNNLMDDIDLLDPRNRVASYIDVIINTGSLEFIDNKHVKMTCHVVNVNKNTKSNNSNMAHDSVKGSDCIIFILKESSQQCIQRYLNYSNAKDVNLDINEYISYNYTWRIYDPVILPTIESQPKIILCVKFCEIY